MWIDEKFRGDWRDNVKKRDADGEVEQVGDLVVDEVEEAYGDMD